MKKAINSHFKSSALIKTVIFLLLFALLISVGGLLYFMFSNDISNLTIEILAAVIGVVLVIVSVAVTIHFQVDAEMEREYKVELFRTKVESYRNFVEVVMQSDDDGEIRNKEIEELRNVAAKLTLYANKDLVADLSRFVEHVREHKSLAIPDNEKKQDANGNELAKDAGTFRSVVFEMRKDLDVVDISDEDDFKKTVWSIIDNNKQI